MIAPRTVRGRLGPAAAVVLASALVLAGCSSGDDTSSDSSSSTPTRSATPSSTVQVPTGVELTKQGSELSFGESAREIFESTQNQGTVLEMKVGSVRQGRISDFAGFILDDSNKKRASYYYARVRVKNVGEGTIGGVPVPMWGLSDDNVLLPPVNFTTKFSRCPSPPLPDRFAPGDTLSTCLVYLAPNRGKLVGMSYRPSQQFDPVVWKGDIKPPLADKSPKKSKKPGKKKPAS